VNLKWNVDGRKPSVPPAEYKAFVAKKRAQFAYLGLTTFLGNILVFALFAYAVQAFQGAFEVAKSTETLVSIVKYNSVGIFLGGVTSYLA